MKFKINKKPAIIGIIVAILFAFLPDPTDVIDGGLPIVESIVALLLYLKGVKSKK